MPKNLIQDEMEYLLAKAIQKCGNLSDAQDLTQETMLSALVYLDKGGTIGNPRSFLVTLLNRRYFDMLRRKYRIPTVTIGEDFDITDNKDYAEDVVCRLGQSKVVWILAESKLRKDLKRWKNMPKTVICSVSCRAKQRTMPYEPSPMIFVYETIKKGLRSRNLGYPCPETIAVFD